MIRLLVLLCLLSSAVQAAGELVVAAARGNDQEVERLLKTGRSVNEVDPNHGWTALFDAAQKGHFSTVKLLLQHGANVNPTPNDPSRAPLYGAWKGRNDQIIQLLIERGGDIDIFAPGTIVRRDLERIKKRMMLKKAVGVEIKKKR